MLPENIAPQTHVDVFGGMNPEEKHLALCQDMAEIKARAIDIGIRLVDMEDSGDWQRVSDSPTFASYCSDYLGLPERTRQRYQAIARTFYYKLGIPRDELIQAHYSKLGVLLPVVTENNAIECVTDAQVLSIGDIVKAKRQGKYTGHMKIEPEPEPEDDPEFEHGDRKAIEVEVIEEPKEVKVKVCPHCGGRL